MQKDYMPLKQPHNWLWSIAVHLPAMLRFLSTWRSIEGMDLSQEFSGKIVLVYYDTGQKQLKYYYFYKSVQCFE
jgi:hypothetical protein